MKTKTVIRTAMAAINYGWLGAAVIALAMVAGSPAAQATIVLVEPTTAAVTASSTAAGFNAGNAVNPAAIFTSAPGWVTGVTPVPAIWPTQDKGAGVNPASGWESAYQAPLSTTWIQFDLGGAYTVSGFHYWGFQPDAYNFRQIETARLQIGNDPTFSLYNYSGTITLQQSGPSLDAGNDYVFGVGNSVPWTIGEYVRLTDIVNYQFSPSTEGYDGLGLIVFEAEIIPEPSTIVLFGCGAVVLWLRRRQQRAA